MINSSNSQRASYSQSSPVKPTEEAQASSASPQASSAEPIDCAAIHPPIETLESAFRGKIDDIVTVANYLKEGTADELDVVQKFNSLLAAMHDAPDSLKLNVLAELTKKTYPFLEGNSDEPGAADASRAIKTAFTEFVRPQVAGANFPQPDIGGNEARKQGLIHWIDTQALPDAIPSSEWLNAAPRADAWPDGKRGGVLGALPDKGSVLLPYLDARDLAALKVTSRSTNELATQKLQDIRPATELSRDKNLVNKWIKWTTAIHKKRDEVSPGGLATLFIGGVLRDKYVGHTPAYLEAARDARSALVRMANTLPELADVKANLRWIEASRSPYNVLPMPPAVQSAVGNYGEISVDDLIDIYVFDTLRELQSGTRPPLPA